MTASPEMIQVAIQVSGAIGLLLTAVGSLIGILVSLRNGRLALAIAKRGADNAHAISQVHVTMNGRLEQLLQVSIALARAEGIAEARADDPRKSVMDAGKLLETALTAKQSLDQAAQSISADPVSDEGLPGPKPA